MHTFTGFSPSCTTAHLSETRVEPCTSYDWNIHMTCNDLQSLWWKLHQKNDSFTESLCRFSVLIFIANLRDSVAFGFDPWRRCDAISARFSSFNPSDMLWTFPASPLAGHRKWVFHGCEWAGVHGVQSAGSGSQVKGRIQRYGLLPGGAVPVCNSCSALVLFCGFPFLPNNGKITWLCFGKFSQTILSLDHNEAAHCESSLYRRAVAQRCPSPPMKTLISVGGQHQGMENQVQLTSLSTHSWQNNSLHYNIHKYTFSQPTNWSPVKHHRFIQSCKHSVLCASELKRLRKTHQWTKCCSGWHVPSSLWAQTCLYFHSPPCSTPSCCSKYPLEHHTYQSTAESSSQV